MFLSLLITMLPIYYLLLHYAYEPFAGDGPGYWRSSDAIFKMQYITEGQSETHFNIGYPLVITALRTLGLKEFGVVVFNFVLHFSSIYLLFLTQRKLKIAKKIIILTVLSYALYFPLYQTLPQIMSEALTAFLFSGIAYLLVVSLQTKKNLNIVLLAVFVTLLMLTRALAPYAILATTFIAVFLKFKNAKYKSVLISIVLSFIFCTPYLIYNFNKTGNIFYWTSQGGSAIYYMTSPYKTDLGDWLGNLDTKDISRKQYDNDAQNRRLNKINNHANTIRIVEPLDVFQEDKVLKKMAFENLKRHPLKYCMNWINNVNRMFFGTPFSYATQHPLAALRIWPNAIVYVSLLLCFVTFLFYNIRKNSQIFILLGFLVISYIGLSSLVTSMPRYIYTLTPVVFVLIAIQLNSLLKLLKKEP